MNTHEHGSTSAVAAARVAAALRECSAENVVALRMAQRTDTEQAQRAERLALISARRAGWWRVLARHCYRDRSVDTVHGLAAVIACETERGRARFWRETARDWRARAEGRPTSDAAGALSNWHELGVSA